jgi:non-ribosomal peptide synthetase component F
VEALSLELLTIYGAAQRGAPPGLDPAVQHADWAAEQQRQLQSPAGQAQYEYWRSRLAELPVLRLPGDSRRHGPAGEVIQEIFTVPAPETAQLRAAGREERATLYMALLSVFAMLLRRWSGQEDLPVGCPEAGRIRPELSTVIGPCIDAFVLRCDLSGNPSFRNVLQGVRDLAMEAYSNRDVSFVTLANEAKPDPTRHPLYQASIVLQEWPSLLDPAYRAGLFARQPVGDVQISRFLDYPLEGTAVDIELMFFERDDELEAVMHCRGDVITPEEAVMLASDFLGLIRRVLAQPDAPLSEFDDDGRPGSGG